MTLQYISQEEFSRVLEAPLDRYDKARLVAILCRINCLYAIMRAGSGHIGTSFSSLDIVTWLHLNLLTRGARPGEPGSGALYFSSKGHDAPGLYAVLTALGWLDFELLHRLRRHGGLPGHPDVSTPGIPTNTGSLGMGISKAKGFIEADRRSGRSRPVYVLTGDGELQEGQIWESLQGARNRELGALTVIVDHNKIQSDTWVRDVADLGELGDKFAAFGWRVERCDGHDPQAIDLALKSLDRGSAVPKVLIADTIKGAGVSFMEGIAPDESLYRFHSGAPSAQDYELALGELLSAARDLSNSAGLSAPNISNVQADPRPQVPGQRLVSRYAEALCKAAEADERIIALDADLVLDTGLIPFASRFPTRFIECGIAEQDMVSQAGGLALSGYLPIVHSFACFLSTRPNEQIYNNATEGTRVIYVGSLAGMVPGGPGHSHQSVRDIALFGSVPGILAVEPCHEDEVELLLSLCLGLDESVYLRLTSVPVEVPFDLPPDYRPQPGHGVTIREGRDAVIVAYGPIMLRQAYLAADLMRENDSIDIAVVDLPWLNRIDAEWLARTLERYPAVILLENHYVRGGQSDLVLATAAEHGLGGRFLRRALTEVPVCGSNDEVLRYHGFDVVDLCSDIRDFLA